MTPSLKHILPIILFASGTVISADGPDPKASFYSAAQDKASSEQEMLRNKILWINQINLVVTKILTYNDKLVLTLEYEKLVDSINYNNLPDGPLRNAIKELIQTLKNLSDSWDQKEIVKKEYIRACDKAFRDAVRGGLKPALSLAKSVATWNYAGAISSSGDIASSFVNYQEQKEEMANAHERKMREIARADANRIHELRNRVWDVFSNEFSSKTLLDQDRVSIQDCKSFMNILKNGSISGQYTVLSGMNNQTRFRCLPVYWYYLGYTASKLKKNAEAMTYLARFKEIYRNLFRYDIYATNTLILEIKILIQDPKSDKAKILMNLEELVKNIENRDWKSRYFAALCYLHLNRPDTAIQLLQQNIEYLVIQTREASNPPGKNRFGNASIPLELLPDGESLAVNRNLLTLARLRKGEKLEKIVHGLLNDFAVSSYEKLYYLGSIGHQTFFRLIEKDVRGITLSLNHRVINSYVEVRTPAPWFYTTDPPVVSLSFFDAAKKKTSSSDGQYTISGWDGKTKSVILNVAINSAVKLPDQAEEIQLTLQSHGLPVNIRYRIIKRQAEKEADPETKWGKIQQWSKKTIKQGKSAWSQGYDYEPVDIMINGKTFPLSNASPVSGIPDR